MELITLTTPEPSTISYKVSQLHFDWPGALIVIGLVGDDASIKTHTYTGAVATTLMVALNKANLSTKSLQKRVIEQLQADGVLVGTISGTPD
jgi:hypothetical protein